MIHSTRCDNIASISSADVVIGAYLIRRRMISNALSSKVLSVVNDTYSSVQVVQLLRYNNELFTCIGPK